jgi:hypothetical protein
MNDKMNENTTVQVCWLVAKLLQQLKESTGAKTYDDVIFNLIFELGNRQGA